MANKEKITIKLNNLKFDAQNPRLPMRLQGVTDESIHLQAKKLLESS